MKSSKFSNWWQALPLNQASFFWGQKTIDTVNICCPNVMKVSTDTVFNDNKNNGKLMAVDWLGQKKHTWSFALESDRFFTDSDFSSVSPSIKNTNQNFFTIPAYDIQTTKSDFIKKVQRIKFLAQSGDLWVLNLAVDTIFPTLSDNDIFAAFERWFAAPGSKMGSILWAETIKFISFSPEMFLTAKQKKIVTRPIKGTGSLEYLQTSEKEQSELSMITDLLRNDLGQIAHSITVPIERCFEKNNKFYQAYAQIEGQTSQPLGWSDYQSLLPAGSISGAPKKRVTHFIQSLEDFDRDFYTGTMSFRPNREEWFSSILIRTFFKKNDVWHYPVGVGITHLSDPEAEWEELHQKIKSVLSFFEVR